jgi:predicted DNA-binding transcriptional regulator YafY
MQLLPVNRQERLAFIELNLLFVGTITRKTLKERFQISDAAATRDLIDYQKYCPDNCTYDNKLKAYLYNQSSFTQQFEIDVNVALLELTGQRQSLTQKTHERFLSSETLEMITKPKVEIVSAITRSMASAIPIEIEYYSVRSGKRRAVIIPHSVVNNGERWHFRAYDREKDLFSDFVITRIEKVKGIKSKVNSYENKTNDTEWNSEVRLVLVPHPLLQNPRSIELDYAMQNGEHRVTVKSALMGYFLRHWNVDCSPADNLLVGKQYHLWLKNNEVILHNQQRFFVPGFENHKIN